MIKTSGYRVSPTEIEDVIQDSGLVAEVAVFGAPHATLGQAIVGAVVANNSPFDRDAVVQHCREQLPAYMVPALLVARAELPRNPNGKIDRNRRREELADTFTKSDT